MAHSAHITPTTWQLPGRLCGTWVDTAACGRGAAWGGLECKPARRPERKQEGRKEQNTHIEDRNRKAASVVQSPRWPTGQPWVKAPEEGLSTIPNNVAHSHTPDTHRNLVHDNRTHWSQQKSWGTFCASSMRRRGQALTVTEAMMKCPRGRASDNGILGDPCFGRGVGAK